MSEIDPETEAVRREVRRLLGFDFGPLLRGPEGDAWASVARQHLANLLGDPPAPPGPSGAELVGNAEACPHREPAPGAERSACGCTHRCAAGMGRRRGGGVTYLDCWECPIAPRRSDM